MRRLIIVNKAIVKAANTAKTIPTGRAGMSDVASGEEVGFLVGWLVGVGVGEDVGSCVGATVGDGLGVAVGEG